MGCEQITGPMDFDRELMPRSDPNKILNVGVSLANFFQGTSLTISHRMEKVDR